MKYIYFLSILLLLSACSNISVDSANAIAKTGDYRSVDDLPYSKHKLNTVDLYIPKNSSYAKPAPVVVFFYGGCWGECVSLYKEDYAFIGEALTSKGYMVVIPNYRMSPEVKYKDIIKDAALSVEWARENVGLFFGDRDNIFLMGHSSGAQLAIMLSLNTKYLNSDTRTVLRGGIGLAGAYDFIPYTESYLPKVFGLEKDAAYSQPINFVHKGEIPLLLMHGRLDKAVKKKNIINLTKKIEEKNEEVKAIYYDDLDHRGILSALSRPLRKEELLLEIDTFIQKNKR